MGLVVGIDGHRWWDVRSCAGEPDRLFAPGKVPGRDHVFGILNGKRPAEVTWGFVEAVADVCSADSKAFAEMKDHARPLWDAFQAETRTEKPGGSSAEVIPLQARVISLQDRLIAERERLREAEAKSVALGKTYLGVIQYLHELLFNMSRAIEELVSKRDDLLARGLGHPSAPFRSATADLHEVRRQEADARAQQDRAERCMADAQALAAQARRKADEVIRNWTGCVSGTSAQGAARSTRRAVPCRRRRPERARSVSPWPGSRVSSTAGRKPSTAPGP
jgi:hypothetical protein